MKIFKIFFKQKFTIYALVGESGTGKSYHAKLVAQKYGLTALIDDGLLIQDDKIIILVVDVDKRNDIYKK